LSREGQEIACHTILHPCDKAMTWVKRENTLEVYTLKRMSRELDQSIALAKEISGKKGPFTFAYPCGESYVGEGKDRRSYVPLVAKKFLAARTTEPGIEMPETVSFPEIHASYGQTGGQLIDQVKKAQAKGGWAVFLFHGVGGDYSSVDLKAHKELLDYLTKNKGSVWTGTFGEVAQYVKKNERKSKQD
jgi:peptidoglycan/xylan/chitin deacetylase (PgdA/CDA1 family)